MTQLTESMIRNYERFSPAQKELIGQWAPRLRMLRRQKKAVSIVQAYPCEADFDLTDRAVLTVASADGLLAAYEEYSADRGEDPAAVALTEQGLVFCLADTPARAAQNYLQLSQRDGAADWQCGTEDKPRFAPAVYGKVCFVTGAAQGLGQGIAAYLASQGAYLLIADLNLDGAAKTAAELNRNYGEGTAFPVAINVSDEAEVGDALNRAVAYYGGIDILVSNAGVLRAGNLEELSFADFNFVTMINYNAYFLMVKYASGIMKLQHQVNPDYWMDIIQINSKSGLVGSKNNSAYAGSKFGGIGLTQSFALELVDSRIKVNAICPGNNLDGPLWTDPVKGLYVQYLNAGKVKGAKSIEDVRDFYLSKVPIKRGCEPDDLGKAVNYLVGQEYETGQALPVTGGQEMLS